VFRLETGKFNGSSFLQVLQQLCSASRDSETGVVITDSARYHHSRRHRTWRDRTSTILLGLPSPYSPELNPSSECGSSRRSCLHNRYFENLKDVISAVEIRVREHEVFRRPRAIT
jgi:hypothetical protein